MKTSGEPETEEELLDLLGEAFMKEDLVRWRAANQLDAAANELEDGHRVRSQLEEKVRDLTKLRDRNADTIWSLQDQVMRQTDHIKALEDQIKALEDQIKAQEARIKELEW